MNVIQPKTKEEKISSGIYLPKQLHNQIKEIAENSNVSVNECIVQLLQMAVMQLDTE